MIKHAASLSLAVLLAACNSVGSGTKTSTDACQQLTANGFSCQQMLTDTVDEVLKPAAASFSTQVALLNTDTRAYCQALGQGSESAARLAAQNAWQAAMANWQQLEVMQVGPIKTQREQFYVWPLNDDCKVDEETLFSTQSDYDITDGVTPARRGLGALEYLLFNTNMGVTCQSLNLSTALASWDNSKSDAEKRQDRCGYAQTITADLVSRVQGLQQSLSVLDLAVSEDGQQAAANALSDALFYIDKKTKDAKIKALLPQSDSDAFHLDRREFQHADFAKEAINANLAGALSLLSANNNVGLLHYLTAAGQTQLASDIVSNLTTALTAVNAINGSFKTILTGADATTCINAADDSTELNKVCTLDEKVKAFTDDLKGQFVLTLGFSTPSDAEGDND